MIPTLLLTSPHILLRWRWNNQNFIYMTSQTSIHRFLYDRIVLDVCWNCIVWVSGFCEVCESGWSNRLGTLATTMLSSYCIYRFRWTSQFFNCSPVAAAQNSVYLAAITIPLCHKRYLQYAYRYCPTHIHFTLLPVLHQIRSSVKQSTKPDFYRMCCTRI